MGSLSCRVTSHSLGSERLTPSHGMTIQSQNTNKRCLKQIGSNSRRLHAMNRGGFTAPPKFSAGIET